MKERPILFSGPMVRAILEGRKTQTRRVVKNAHIITCDDKRGATDTPCPFGVPGDRLWVRETWWHDEPFHADCLESVEYAADHQAGWHPYPNQDGVLSNWVKRASIHMPRWASRITLEVVSVRVERLQEIREEDAIAEGAERNVIEGAEATWTPEMGYRLRCCHYPEGCECFPHATARDWFAEVWESMYGEGAWAANPWVWVVEFRRLTP